MLLHAQNKETILFSGFDWHQKVASKPTGPGGNIFGVHHKNVTIDRDGCLNLRVVNQNACAEVFSELFFKEGTFETVIETNINKFAPELVFGMFLYDETAAPHFNEIDFEIARWGDSDSENMQYAIYDNEAIHLHRFSFLHGKTITKHVIHVTDERIRMQSYFLNQKTDLYELIQDHSVRKPHEFSFNATRFHYNLWVFGDDKFQSKCYPKVKIISFKYNPIP